MIGPLEKGINAATLATPPSGVYEGVNLAVLPKYISFRAALLHNKLTHQWIILVLAGLLVTEHALSRIESYSLHERLRQKEYILAPGVQSFTPASPQSVSEEYIGNVVNDVINKLGNVSPGNIDAQYKTLAGLMNPQLAVRFAAEASGFIAQLKAENIVEVLTVSQQQITPSGDGYYHIVAYARRDRYINNEYTGHTDEAIEMVLQLVAVQRDRPWYVQINSLSRIDADLFRKKKSS